MALTVTVVPVARPGRGRPPLTRFNFKLNLTRNVQSPAGAGAAAAPGACHTAFTSHGRPRPVGHCQLMTAADTFIMITGIIDSIGLGDASATGSDDAAAVRVGTLDCN